MTIQLSIAAAGGLLLVLYVAVAIGRSVKEFRERPIRTAGNQPAR